MAGGQTEHTALEVKAPTVGTPRRRSYKRPRLVSGAICAWAVPRTELSVAAASYEVRAAATVGASRRIASTSAAPCCVPSCGAQQLHPKQRAASVRRSVASRQQVRCAAIPPAAKRLVANGRAAASGIASEIMRRLPARLRGVFPEVFLVKLQVWLDLLHIKAHALVVPVLSQFEPQKAVLILAFMLSAMWMVAFTALLRSTDNYSTNKKCKGLYIRRRPKNKCRYCKGFGIVQCDLCGATGFLVYEKKFMYTDPCAKCYARRWSWCDRCGGSGDRSKPWGEYSLPRVIYALFPG